MASITAISAFPWMIKPLYGFLSDTVPILGYKRRSYLIICGLLGMTCLLQLPGSHKPNCRNIIQTSFPAHKVALRKLRLATPVLKEPTSVGTTSWLAMATAVSSPTGAVIATVVGSLSTACSDVVVDSIVVERSRGAPQVPHYFAASQITSSYKRYSLLTMF